jgi:NitT/TauT family transport system substrate-binding protein
MFDRRVCRALRGLGLAGGALLCSLLILATIAAAQMQTLRLGHFPNITHVQALVAHHLTRQGKGWFEERLGGGIKIDWYVYNAGPSAMEAIFANSVDLTYVGPNPAINAYVKSQGTDIRVVAGAVNGGAALVVQPDAQLGAAADFKGKKIGTPQLGNTQDVAARAWLAAGGLKITQAGGEAHILPTANPDQLALFKQKQLDAVWTVEPWVSRLELEAQGKVLLEQPDAVTTILVAGVKVLGAQRETVAKFVAAHNELTEWIKANPAEAQRMVREELAAETRTAVAPELVERAWKRIVLTGTVSRTSLETFMASAQAAGFLRGAPDLSRLIERP